MSSVSGKCFPNASSSIFGMPDSIPVWSRLFVIFRPPELGWRDEFPRRTSWYYLSASIDISALPGGLASPSWGIPKIGWKRESPEGREGEEQTYPLHHSLLESKVQTRLSPPYENQLTTCFHPLMDMPHYGGCKSVLLTSAMLLCASSKGRISIEAYKCPAVVANSPQRSESAVQLPDPVTYPCPRASLEPCKCQN